MNRFTKIFFASAAIALMAGSISYTSTSYAESHGGNGLKKGQGMGQGKGHGMGQGKGRGRGKMHRMRGSEGEKGQRGFMRRFAIVDVNSDDRIGADEAAAWRESVFAAMDADDSNDLTMEEFMAVRMGKGEGRNAERKKKKQAKKQARFKPMDKDSSGAVSIAEWMDAGKASFAKADADGDGNVTPWEFRASRKNH